MNARPHDPAQLRVCLDASATHLVAPTRPGFPMHPGQPAGIDYADARRGPAKLFLVFAPLAGGRHGAIPAQRTAIDYAQSLTMLADLLCAHVPRITLVQDNRHPHNTSSLYEAFPPEEARRLVERFEWQDTPKHGSWLKRAASACAHLAHQCLDRPIPDKTFLKTAVI